MFSQAHLQKNTHKKVFSLVEISNICQGAFSVAYAEDLRREFGKLQYYL
jgi:hypothetical protein